MATTSVPSKDGAMSMIPINQPETLAEVSAVFARYERALLDNDAPTLIELFWNAPQTVRYGIDEIHHGHRAIAEFRRSQAAATMPRQLRNVVITTFGDDVATVDAEFVPVGFDAVGRQSQTWVRTTDGWRGDCCTIR